MNIMDISWDASQRERHLRCAADLPQSTTIRDVPGLVRNFIRYFNVLL